MVPTPPSARRDVRPSAIQPAIETFGLSRRFGRRTAVDGLDLHVPAQSIYGFLGRNGAGKTTTIRMILGLIRPSAGRASVFGLDTVRDRLGAAARVGSMVETPSLYDRLTGRENLEIVRRLRRAPAGEVNRVLDVVDLRDAANRLAGGYSQGMRQRLGIARALIGRPDLLVLDEPTNGLDPDGIRELREFIRVLPEREGTTLFVSSHLLAEVEQVATHVGLMHDGRLLAQSPLAELKAAQVHEIEIGVEETDRALSFLLASGFDARRGEDGSLLVGLPADHGPRGSAALNRRLMGEGFDVFRLAPRDRSLEAIYLDMVGAAAAPTRA